MYTIEEIKAAVLVAVDKYNRNAQIEKRIVRVELFGSYASGNQTDDSDIDFLVEFASPVVGLFVLAEVLELLEQQFDCSVDMVKIPLPHNSILQIERTVPLYEAA